mmetsp:Transcript_16954/g.64576  ORF Transcript_16954/g.64576 Transcript_16954/m.64576 type:complete len:224 (+) Transcript_16954:566-1237(+)
MRRPLPRSLVLVDMLAFHVLVGNQSSANGIHVLYYAPKASVRVCRRKLQLAHQPVQLVEYQDGNNSLSPSLAQYRLGLNADPFDDVHNHNRAVTQPRRGGHVRAEVDVARTIDQVHQKHVGVIRRRPSRWCWGQGWRLRRPWRVHMALQRFSILMLIPQTYRRGLHGYSPFLLIFRGIQEAQAAREALADDAVAGDEGISQTGFPVIHVSNDANVADAVAGAA